MSSLQLYRTLDLETLELHAVPSHESRRLNKRQATDFSRANVA